MGPSEELEFTHVWLNDVRVADVLYELCGRRRVPAMSHLLDDIDTHDPGRFLDHVEYEDAVSWPVVAVTVDGEPYGTAKLSPTVHEFRPWTYSDRIYPPARRRPPEFHVANCDALTTMTHNYHEITFTHQECTLTIPKGEAWATRMVEADSVQHPFGCASPKVRVIAIYAHPTGDPSYAYILQKPPPATQTPPAATQTP